MDRRQIIAPEEISHLPRHEIVVRAPHDIRLPGVIQTLETGIAGQIDAVRILQPDQIGKRPDQRFEEIALLLHAAGGIGAIDAGVFRGGLRSALHRIIGGRVRRKGHGKAFLIPQHPDEDAFECVR
jgi:hypothetical protein